MLQAKRKKLERIETDDTLMETATHGTVLFPFRFYEEKMSDFDFHLIDWHWHAEFEFVYMETGTVHFNIGEKTMDLCEGQGIFINSRILHRMHSENDAVIPNFLFLPSLIAPAESLIYQKYVSPVLDSSLDYVVFSSVPGWQAETLSEMQKLIQLCRGEMNELLISGQIQKIWALITSHVICYPKAQKPKSSSLARIQLMMEFIHSNYADNISLEDIAKAGDVSVNTALHLFRAVLNISPVNYLVHYRLKKAAMLLTNTERKISTVSVETGFSSSDYFCKTFKKVYRLTPTEYRRGKSHP